MVDQKNIEYDNIGDGNRDKLLSLSGFLEKYWPHFNNSDNNDFWKPNIMFQSS